MDYTVNIPKEWIVMDTAQNNGLYWQQLKKWIVLATDQNRGLYWQHLKTMDYTSNSSKE